MRAYKSIMAVTVDINPWGKVLDYRAEGAMAETLKSVYLEEGGLALKGARNGELDILAGCYTFQLKVSQTLGGNQWNVWQNLTVLRGIFDGLQAQAHFGLGDESAIARRNLYLPGLPKVNLTRPNTLGDLLFARPPEEQNFMISSAPHGEESGPYWKALQNYLDTSSEGSFYFNPASQQVRGSVPREVLEGMRGRVSIFQVNEEEAGIFARTYGGEGTGEEDLPALLGSDWTVVSRGAKGLRMYAGGECFEVGVPSNERARRILGDIFCEEGHDVGCGDSVLATLIAIKETRPDLHPEMALKMAADMGSIQYYHKGSNLFAVYGE